MNILRLLIIILIFIGCGKNSNDFIESYKTDVDPDYNYLVRSYPDKELDSIWKYTKEGVLVSIYAGDSLGRCLGPQKVFYPNGEIYYTGKCESNLHIGKWYFYRKSGSLHFINFYTERGELYQRWFPNNGDTTKMVYPIIELDPLVATTFDTVFLKVNYKLDYIDTTGWDYFLVYDFVEKERFEKGGSLPFEEFFEKYEGQKIEGRFEFMVPGEIAMYGYTLAVNRETGDSIFHLEIRDQFLTIVDTVSQEL